MRKRFQPSGLGNANLVGSNEEKQMVTDGTETTMITSFCDVYNCTSAIFPTGNNLHHLNNYVCLRNSVYSSWNPRLKAQSQNVNLSKFPAFVDFDFGSHIILVIYKKTL